METRNSYKVSLLRVILSICLTVFCGSNVSAETENGTAAPLNPAFVRHITALKAGKVILPASAESGHALGQIPEPMTLDHMTGINVFPGYRELVSLPISYDLRTQGKLTAVRDQGACGACWTFATYGSLESTLLPGETDDFSENHLKNSHGFDTPPCDGGNGRKSTAYLARWSGPVNETDDPYNPSSGISPSGLSPPKHIQDVYIIPARSSSTDNDNLKNAILNYGAIYVSMGWYGSTGVSSAYWNNTTHAYYYNGSDPLNHGVAIVGWDDNYPRTRFATTAPGDGAFIVRNSWGSVWGDAGYFYISYYDGILARSDNYSFMNAEPITNFGRIYQYDPLGWINSWGYSSTTGWFSNIFTAVASEELSAVAFYSASPNSPHEIYIYTGVTAGSPRSGTLAATQTGSLQMAGYNTITLSSPVSLISGERFSIVVKLTTPGFDFPIPVERQTSGYSSAAAASPGQSFISSNGNTWSDTTLRDATTNVCLKGFTIAAPVTYTISQSAPSFNSSGNTGTVVVIASSSDSSWTATSNVSWITITSGSSLTGSGTVTYSVAANATGSTRTGTITVAGATITVTQTAFNKALYFPHIATIDGWQTEIAIVNTSPGQSATGTLRALSDDGQLIETKPVTLPARGRRQIIIANEFTSHTSIRHIIFDANSNAVQGYTKFFIDGVYRVAIPAIKEVNTGDIYVTHIASSSQWWTGLSLVNTTATEKTVTITFSDGQTKQVTIAAIGHRAFAIRDLFNGQPQPGIESAVITNASSVIGLELFGSFFGGSQLEGILLTDKTASALYYPHVESNGWWTGIVAYNPSALSCTITITPYDAQGTPLTPSILPIPGKAKYIGTVAGLGLPAQTAWFKIDSTRPLSGFELISSNDFEQLAGYAGNGGTSAKTGVFAKIEKYGWTTIALVNTEDTTATVTLTAYADNGTPVATSQVFYVGSHAKLQSSADGLFSKIITDATYIAYTSDKNMVGLQLDGTADWKMLDGLPILIGEEPTYSISGIVHSGSNSGPVLSGATVSIAGKTAITSGAGTFTITNIPAGTYSLSISKTGYVTYTNPAYNIGSNQTGQHFYIIPTAPVLVCPEHVGVSSNGIQFYGSTSYQLSTTVGNAIGTSTLTWGAWYQNIYYLPWYYYSGSLRARLFAVPYSFSGSESANFYNLGTFTPNFTGTGAYSANQLYVGYHTTSPASSSLTVQNPPVGSYCIVAFLEEYTPTTCSSSSGYCYDQWIQFSGPMTFH